ncbi:MAG: PHB depolymerase family esterase [Brumimicrobium sp.]
MKLLLSFLFTSTLFFLSISQTTLVESIQHDGMTREYRVYIPAVYDATENVPLIFNLHGYTSNAFEQENYGDFRSIADTANFIIVHPEGTEDSFGEQWWNAFGSNQTADDVDFISTLIDSVSAEYMIDPNRIYSTGMSNGGFMSFELACSLGNRIAAVASVTGSMPVGKFTSCNAPKPTPIMQIHGTDDGTVPYNGNTSFEPIEDVVDFWVDQTNCNPTPTVTTMPDIDTGDGSTAERYLYTGGDQNTTIEHFKIQNGGHTWPGAPVDIGVTNHDIDASVEIWRFFSQYKLDNLVSVQEQKLAELFKLYPNPSEGTVHVEFDQSVDSYEVVDALGREILKNDVSKKEETIQIDKKGVYFIQFESDAGATTKKFIIQ